MAEAEENHEKIRVLFSMAGTPLPKHELTNKLIGSIYNEEEARIVSKSFSKIREYLTVDQISEKSGVKDKERLKKLLDRMVYIGSLMKGKESTYYIMSYLPGIFETYFTSVRDSPERLREAGKAHRGLRKISFRPDATLPKVPPTDFNKVSGWRYISAMEPVLRTVEINEDIEVKNEILPYEVLEQYLSKYEVFSETPCSCRESAKLAGEPCERTKENFCIQAGKGAEEMIRNGTGKALTFEEAMSRLKACEKDGLVHSTTNQQAPSGFICNCCPCCCMAMAPVIQGFRLGVARANFQPIVDHDECTLCDTCVEICPVGIVSHQEDSDGEKIVMDLSSCLGCGLCASNCPQEAITLEKIRTDVPHESMGSIFS